MTLEYIWSDFAKRMSEVELTLRAIRNATTNEHAFLAEQKDRLERDGEPSRPIAMNHVTYVEPITGTLVFYKRDYTTVDEAYKRLLLRKNKQYQWLLAEAYEIFDRFLVQLYAYVASIGLDIWPLEDYGNITISEADEQSFRWYIKQAEKKKRRPKSILRILRANFDLITTTERYNYHGIHLGFALSLITESRRRIVHNRGWTGSKRELIQEATKSSGVSGGKLEKECKNWADQFFGSDEYANMILVVEAPKASPISLGIYQCRLHLLLSVLLGYAHLLAQAIQPDMELFEPD